MSNYQYPDTNDELVCKLIDKVEPFKGYWEKSEKKVIDEMRNEILKYMKRFNIEECFLLDAGCGIGRLVGEFQEYFYRIVAIEPDKKRFAETVKNISNTSYSSKVELRNILIQELDNEEKYDVILCSHILQHIQTEELAKVLQKLKAILKPNGLLLITTCHSIEEEDLYIKAAESLKIKRDDIKTLSVFRKSIDARKKDEIMFIYALDVELFTEYKISKRNNNVSIVEPFIYEAEATGEQVLKNRPVIVGSGPAGLFCALLLAEKGYNPIVLERGK
ncbi:MAG TPA: hypothetical protein DEG71_02555, partial [Clostridiales bacterium]|nr:hypothetical protein [Clostridiales bacterium]